MMAPVFTVLMLLACRSLHVGRGCRRRDMRLLILRARLLRMLSRFVTLLSPVFPVRDTSSTPAFCARVLFVSTSPVRRYVDASFYSKMLANQFTELPLRGPREGFSLRSLHR